MDKRTLIVQAALERIGCGYIYGATGWICTEARLQAQAKQYPEYAAKIFKYGREKWMGLKCYDCAQLARVAASAAGYSLVSGSNSQWTKTTWAQKGTIATLQADSRGLFLFVQDSAGRMKHVGVCIGDGTVVEARGHAYGVVRRQITAGSWTHWAMLPGLEGEEVPDTQPTYPIESDKPTLRKGSVGPYVVAAQNLLMAANCHLPKYGADGQFGNETLAAVKTFQTLSGLTPDGIIGPMTWGALLEFSPEDVPDEPPQEDLYTVTIPGLDLAQADALLAAYPGATKAVG